MKLSWRTIARLNRLMSSGTFTQAGYRKLALGTSFAVTTVGLAVAYKDLGLGHTLGEENIKTVADVLSFKNLISLLGSNEVLAEETSSKSTKVHPSNVSSLMKTGADIPPAQWDSNWDKREPTSLVRSLKSNPSNEEIEAHEAKVKEKTPTAKRTYILVRHGQYEMKDTDEERILTELGRDQANSTGERLNILWKHFQTTQSGKFYLNRVHEVIRISYPPPLSCHTSVNQNLF